MAKVPYPVVTFEEVIEGLKYDYKIYKKVLKKNPENLDDIVEHLEAYHASEYIKFLLNEVFTGHTSMTNEELLKLYGKRRQAKKKVK